MFGKAKKGQKQTSEAETTAAITRMQSTARRYLAVKRVQKRAKLTWQRVFDPAFKIYFWFNKINGQAQWTLPRFIDKFSDKDFKAAAVMNRTVRAYIGKMRVRRASHQRFTRFYDSTLNRFYWMDNSTEKTTWKASPWLMKQDIPMPPEDVQLHEAMIKIKELEKKLKDKDKEIKDVRKQRYDELEPKVLADRVKNASLLKRSKNMDEWSIDELSAWFTELKMEEYISFIYGNRVDGNLFINLSDEDWIDMGISNKFHTRKLQIILKSYRIRYQRKKEKIYYDEDDELLSEYAPSELSDMIHAEGKIVQESESESSEESYESEEEEIELTAEQLIEKELDDANISIEVLVPGDGRNFPMIGDIVRIRYVCFLISTGKVSYPHHCVRLLGCYIIPFFSPFIDSKFIKKWHAPTIGGVCLGYRTSH